VYSQVLNTADGDLLVDYSKNIINDEVMKMLVDLVCNYDTAVSPVLTVLLQGEIPRNQFKNFSRYDMRKCY